MGRVTVGQMVNLLSNDVQRFDYASMFLHYIWIMPMQAVVAFYMMYRHVGLAALAGCLAITLQAVPLQGIIYFMFFFVGVYQKKIWIFFWLSKVKYPRYQRKPVCLEVAVIYLSFDQYKSKNCMFNNRSGGKIWTIKKTKSNIFKCKNLTNQ